MKVKFQGKDYQFMPTGKKSKRGGGVDINGNETEVRTHKQSGLYDEFGNLIFTCGTTIDISGNVKVYSGSKCIGSTNIHHHTP